MAIKRVTFDQAEAIFAQYGINIPFWTTCQVQVPGYDGMVCDHRALSGYTVAFTCEVWDVKAQKQVERFNIMR